MDYDKACNMASDDQGITTIVNALSAQGITATVCQTGGFCMVADIELGDGWYVWAMAENACLYHVDHELNAAVVADMPKEMPAEVSAHVANFVRGWREGLQTMRDSRRRVESLREALPNDYPCDIDSAGYVYAGGAWIADHGREFCVTVSNHGHVGALADCEAYLYGWHVRGQG